jgi:L-lactate utilization protein LutB
MKKNKKLEDNKEKVSILFQKYLENLEDKETLQDILQIIDENHNNSLELKELKKIIDIIETTEFKKDLSEKQIKNLSFFIKKVDDNIEKLEKKFFFKKMKISEFVESIVESTFKKSIVLLSSGCSGVKFFTNEEINVIKSYKRI